MSVFAASLRETETDKEIWAVCKEVQIDYNLPDKVATSSLHKVYIFITPQRKSKWNNVIQSL